MQTLKSLFVTLLVLGGAFLAYDYYLAPDADKLVFKRPSEEKKVTVPPAVPPPATTGPVEMVTPPPPVASTRPAPVTQSAPPPTMPATAKSDGFVPPVLPDVEHATEQWARIPASAFPRSVKLSRAITFKASFGATEVPAGSEVTVMSAQDQILTVAPNAQSELRATVELDSTDLKENLTQVYDAWRARRIEAAREAWARRNDSPVSQDALPVAADGKPEMGPDGTYPLLLASMRAGDVTEITPTNITRWGRPVEGKFKSERCWDVPVDFDAQTAFGKISSTAVAKVVRGRVAGWFYLGSGESVP